ncbi:MraY family glycosyltransferase [Prosthecobacter sp.]|uniref:MraY family glycosyltransferase n=1 Tax=Prosthecobacter sp. TaxID=1965333 RepID=UPI003783535E
MPNSTFQDNFVGPWAPRHVSMLEMSCYFGGALLVAALGTWWILKREGVVGMDAPDTRRKLHEKAVSRLGGAPIFLAVSLACLVAGYIGGLGWTRWLPVAVCNALIFSVGFVDDLKPLGAKVKLVGQIGTALILYALGVSIDILSNPFGEGALTLGWWSLPITLLWLVTIPNIVNLIDGMDGLAGGFGLFLCLTLAFLGYYRAQPDVLVVSLAMAGALAGFLIFNLPPAKIFLGDGGAYLIGFFIASVSLFTSDKGSIIGALLVIIIALGVPILDTLFAILRRAIRGVSIFNADAEHIHHRLILLGYSKGRALAAMYAVCLALSLVGLSILMTKGIALPVAGAVLFLLALGAARYLGYVRSWSNFRAQLEEVMERRRQREFFRAYGRVLDFEVERCEEFRSFDSLFQHGLGRMGLSVQPVEGYQPEILPMGGGRQFTLYRPKDDTELNEWHLRLDVLLPALERCHEKWSRLPVSVEAGAPPSSTLVPPSLPA